MKRSSGFTLIETLISTLILSLIAISIYNGFTQVTKAIRVVRIKQNAAALANEQFEVIRNLPYNDVGIISGLPVGVLPREKTLTRGGFDFIITTTIRSVDQPFDGTVSDGDLSPADTKFVQIDVACPQCGADTDYFSYASQIAPKGLETSEGNGALFVRVFDADGQPIQSADVKIINNALSPSLDIDEITNVNGMLQIVDAPPSNASYEISVTKDGFSTEKTYLIGDADNPAPHVPHSNVAVGLVTQVSFAIDELSDVSFETTDRFCQDIGNIDFSLTGSKTIGVNRFKYDEDHVTDGSGDKIITDLEWDTYDVVIDDAVPYHLAGSNPTLPLTVNPGSNQTMNLVVTPKDTKGLLVQVLDAATGLPLSDATVTVDNGSVITDVTGRGFLRQTDWSGGSGQEMSVDETRFSAETDIDYSTLPGQLTLDFFGGFYGVRGELESSIFDVGTAANFHTLSWQPGSQSISVGDDPVLFQIATNTVIDDPVTGVPNPWNYIGPDGTDTTFYSSPGETLNGAHNGSQFIRYKVFLETEDVDFTPNVSDVSFTFSGDCIPTGEVLFQGLSSDDYDVSVARSGYIAQSITDYTMSDDFQVLTITMSQ